MPTVPQPLSATVKPALKDGKSSPTFSRSSEICHAMAQMTEISEVDIEARPCVMLFPDFICEKKGCDKNAGASC